MNRQQILSNTPTGKSTAGDWINFHESLTSVIGKKNANEVFKSYWSKLGNNSANTGELRNYLKDNGINLESGNYIGNIVDFSYDIGDSFSSFLSTTKYVAFGIAAIIIIPLGIALFNVAKSAGTIATNVSKR
jgi:hypothetical protein